MIPDEGKEIHMGWFHEPVYKGPSWFRRAISIWIVVFTLIVGYALHKVDSTSAREAALEQTNCGLKQFLLTARQSRIASASRETGRARKGDLAAARGYLVLAERFTAVGHCKLTIPPKH